MTLEFKLLITLHVSLRSSRTLKRMASTELTCQIRVVTPQDHNAAPGQPENSRIVDLRDYPVVNNEIRDQWATEIVRHVEAPTFHRAIRPWSFLAHLDGSVDRLEPLSAPEDNRMLAYPARLQIPPETISDLDQREQVMRTEKFAMASLIYEVDSKVKVFENLPDIEVQERFCNADFPDDAFKLPHSLIIASGWSEEFLDEMERQGISEYPHSAGLSKIITATAHNPNLFQRVVNDARAHPIRTTIQVAGAAVATVSLLAGPLLGLAGFTALGPAAGSAAAAWQSSIGAVQAGSLFAFFQGAAMGGAAMGVIQGVGMAGAAGAILAKMADVPGLVDTFRRVCRRVERPEGRNERAQDN